MVPISSEILIKNVGKSADESDVRYLLRQFRPKYVQLLQKDGGSNAAIASFDSPDMAREAIERLNGYDWIDGMSLLVNYNTGTELLRQVPDERSQPIRGGGGGPGGSIPPPDHALNYWSGGPLNTMGPRQPPQLHRAPPVQVAGLWQDDGQDDVAPPPPALSRPRPPPPQSATIVDADDFFGGSSGASLSGPAPPSLSGRVPFYSSELPSSAPAPARKAVTFEDNTNYRNQPQYPPQQQHQNRSMMMAAPSGVGYEPPASSDEIPFEQMGRSDLISAAYRLKEENRQLKQLLNERKENKGPQQQWRQPGSYGYESTGPSPPEPSAANTTNRFQFDYEQAGSRSGGGGSSVLPMRRSLEGGVGYEETPTTSGMRGGRGAGGTLGMRGGRGGGAARFGFNSDEGSRFGADDVRNEKLPDEMGGGDRRPMRRDFGEMERRTRSADHGGAGDEMGAGDRRPMRRDFGGDTERNDRFGDRDRGTGGNNCHRCGKPGHFARECTESGEGGRMSGGGACYKCGGSGHFARECPQTGESNMGGGGNKCFNCGQPGHMSRECPQKSGMGGGRMGGGGMRDGGRVRRDNFAPTTSSSSNKGMVDDEFAETAENEEPPKPSTTSELALERPAQGTTGLIMTAMTEPEEEQENMKPPPSSVKPPTPAPVSEVKVTSPPIEEEKEKPPQPAPTTKTRVNLPMMPMFPKPGASKPSAPSVAVPVAPVAPVVELPAGSCCASCTKPLTIVVKNCPDCRTPMCGAVKCLEQHATSQQCKKPTPGSTLLLSPDFLRQKEAEKQKDAWKNSLDELQTKRFEKLPKRKPVSAEVINFKNPDDFWVVVEKAKFDEFLYKKNLPKLASNAEVIPESSRDLKPGLLAYSTIPLKPLTRSGRLVAPWPRTIDSMVSRSGDSREIILDHGDFVRCLVLSVNYETLVAEVFSLDGAFEAEVPAAALRFIGDGFKDTPVRAIHATMAPFLAPPSNTGNWPSYEVFTSLQSRQFIAVFDQVIDGKISCHLSDPEADFQFVEDSLLRDKLASSKSVTDAATLIADGGHSYQTAQDWLLDDKEFDAKFSTIRTLDDFSLMIFGSATDPGKLLGQLCRFYDQLPNEQAIKPSEPGQLVVVGKRGNWDRGVWRPDGSIDLVDSGHRLTPNQTQNLSIFPLRYQFLIPPAIGIERCRLQEGIINSIDYFDKEMIATFGNLVAERSQVKLRLIAKEIEENKPPCLVVNFVDPKFGQQISAKSKRPLAVIGFFENYISIDQIVTAMILETGRQNDNVLEAKITLIGPEYEKAREALQSLTIPESARRPVPRPALYQVCLRVTKDEEGYEMISRVKVLGKSQSSPFEKVLVEMMDTAEIEEVPINQLIESTKEIAELRRLALRCCVELSPHYDETVCQYQTLDLKAGYQDGWRFTVRRFLMNQGHILRAAIDGKDARGIVYNVNDPDSFYVLINAYEELEQAIQQYAESEPARYADGTALIAGELCVAKFEDVWYRAVVRKAGVNPRVEFVDYGNEGVIENPIEDLRPFNEKLGESKWPFQGVVCQLSGVAPKEGVEWSPETISHLKATILDQAVAFSNVGEGQASDYVVRLIREEDELDVAADLIKQGFARKV